MTKNVSIAVDGDGVALITWDMAGRSMNVLNTGSMTEFAAAVTQVLSDAAIKGAVIASGKPAFIAGADLDELEGISSGSGEGMQKAKAIYDWVMEIHTLFRRMETAPKPFAVAINGTALGGGFELCLACHRRFAADDPKAQIGLPESKVGLFPGGGGTQRYLRMLGAAQALPLLLEGKTMPPRDALALGLVDEVAPRDEIVARARQWVLNARKEDIVRPWDRPGFVPPGPDPRTAAGATMLSAGYAMQRKRTLGNYPHLDAILKTVHDGFAVPMNTALRLEAKQFTKVMLSPTTRNIIRTQFINMQKANKLTRRPKSVAKREITRIGVLGAGMMGAAIAHVSARAGVEVVLIDRDQASADAGRDHARRMNEAAVARGRMKPADLDALLGSITATTDYEKLRGVQMIIEAVFEDRAVKAEVTRRAEAMLAPDGVFASNTSTLPITGLAGVSLRPERFIGLHFFSPVEKMPLVEIIMGQRTGDEALAMAMDFVQRIRKTPIVVNDGRGFYASRVFATYTGEGMEMLCEGVAPALIENAGRLAGMPMPPLALSDEVALDLIWKVGVQTAKDLGRPYPGTRAERLVARMVEQEKRLGKKAGKGFYDYPAEGRKRLWPDLAGIAAPAVMQPDVEELKTRFLTIQALEAARCYEENVVTDPADADIGALLGWGFAPWTGGPLSYIELVGTRRFVETCDRLAQTYGERFKPNPLLRRLAESNAPVYPAAPKAA
jgi:3-hydroxyacyl-CoA dehydrogenase/enoyl-CoA hydratase/3-hydroxybutyryl-CoA epimerase